MSKQFKAFDDDHMAFVASQPIFFVASCAPGARINLSPKGMDSMRILGPNLLAWLNLTGSGNETAAQLPLDPRMTVMWCSFGTRPLILRGYGTARVLHRGDAEFADYMKNFPQTPGARQIFVMAVDLVQTSCGYAVPLMQLTSERPTLRTWAEGKGEAGVAEYWGTRNRQSIDGFPTGIEANL